MNDKAQLHTLEGLGAAVLMTLTILTITQSTMIVTPQNELAIDVHLEQISSDALTVLDRNPVDSDQYNLTECIASWDMTEASYPDNMTGNLDELDAGLQYLLPDTLYNVDLAYIENGDMKVDNAIIRGPAGKNSVVTRHFVTLTNETVSEMGGSWNLGETELRVVEVRLTAWEV
ncbi:MAG: hypothetical protein PWQ44_1544 [Methanolobus sp.]|nr:hypothetical protein [Methanolobus sp.]